MDRRTYEGHMEWEYENDRPLDPTSPFAMAARSNSHAGGSTLSLVFATPSKPTARSNLFGGLTSISKSQASPPQSSSFHPNLRPQPSAPPFRNPAFTTPRKPFDEVVMSEASGAEDSPAALTENSDYPNDTPEIDRFGELNMGANAPKSPSKVDKLTRYGKSGPLTKKATSGKGEIRGHRSGFSATDVARKRKRHLWDRDVGSASSHRQDWDGSDSDSDEGYGSQPGRGRSRTKQGKRTGFVGSLFHMLDEHPNAPENLTRWISFGFNLLLVFISAFFCWGAVNTVRSDIYNANEAARSELMSKMTECQTQYTLNECSRKDRPALREMCDEWYDCMMQNPESIMRVKVTAKQIAEIINEFAETMSLRAWVGSSQSMARIPINHSQGFIFVIVVGFTFGNAALSRYTVAKPAPEPQRHSSRDFHEPSMSADGAPAWMYIPVQTPMRTRHEVLDDATDTDSSPPKMRAILAPQTPSGRRSPSKGERILSPSKVRRSPSKKY
ncbi:hypothetical protein S40293_02115 [Stachybotrys chartarum IBT 40293]|nr:hypothetical protein S40293_02115 [Stachybotrys chartarum IBT 40293]KFA71822.1 hypothetical protein S40288_07944 [Stachybotrys chartarum IBT 40288]